MTGELLVIALVFMLAFNPSKWPMLVHHLAKALRVIQRYKHRAQEIWQQQLDLYQLEENKKKAADADTRYDERG